MTRTLLRAPSAWLPFAMSFIALAMILVYVMAFGVTRNEDEGAPARLFQLLMVIDAAVIAVFAARWLPRAPGWAATVLSMQVLAACLPIVAIVVLEGQVSI